jgi:hypothetical protein
MKKLYTLVAVVACALSVNAQSKMVTGSASMSTVGLPAMSAERAVTDTLVGYSWTNTSAAGPTIYTCAGGYVVGNNNYGDLAKAQAFVNSIGSIAVDGAIIWFGAKEHDGSAGATSKVVVKEYSLTGAGTASTGAVTNAPSTANASSDLLFSVLDTGTSFTSGANTIMFTTPVMTSTDFAIGVDVSTLGAGDTVGIVSSTDGDGGATEMTWEKWSDNSWHTMMQAWPLDIDFFIWALVDDFSGVNEGYINGARLDQNTPNPAANLTTVNYTLENATDNVSLRIFDVTGKIVRTYEEGNVAAGSHSINVSTADLEAGVYYYALTAGKGRVAKKMIVTK